MTATMTNERSAPEKRVLTSSCKEEFSAFLDAAAAHPGLWVVSNRYPWQARMAAEKLLEVAKDGQHEVRVLTGRGHEGFYNPDFASRLQGCKAAGCRIRFLVWQKTTDCVSTLFKKLSEDGDIELRVSGTDEFEEKIPHFLLVGDKAFRQEAGHKPFTDQTKFTEMEPQVPARIDFDDPQTGKTLSDLFESLWGDA